MVNKFERRLSIELVFLVVILFLLTISQRFVDSWFFNLSWYIAFILSWILMLVFSFSVLLDKNARGYSILTAIVTSLAFGLLSIHGLSALARFVRVLPTNLAVNNEFFIANNQLIFYSCLIVVYFFHMINALLHRRKDQESKEEIKEASEEELRQRRDDKLNAIIAEIDSQKNSDKLTDEDREILNTHLLEEAKNKEAEDNL